MINFIYISQRSSEESSSRISCKLWKQGKKFNKKKKKSGDTSKSKSGDIKILKGLYVSDPINSIPPVLSFLQRFGSFSGYKVNISKSECYPINAPALQLNQSDIPFKLSPAGFRYLGINVTRTLTSLSFANFSPLVSKIKSDLQKWRSLPLSLIGRINTVKMNILPKFLFLFQCLPLFLPKRFFKTVDQDISSFLWCGKAPRICKSVLQMCKLSGGLSLPNLQLYYWATHIHKISFWFKLTDPLWHGHAFRHLC